MELRPYQLDAIDAALSDFESGLSKLLIVIPTGGGKTIVFSNIAKRTLPGRTLILAHREELIDQAIGKLYQATGIIAGKEKAEFRARLEDGVVVASVQSMQGDRIKRWPVDHFEMIIVDEAHHILAASYKRILAHFSGAKVLGVTATPDRGDKQCVGKFFEKISYQIGLPNLIDQGYLVPIVSKTIPLAIDISAVSSSVGDFNASGLDERLGDMLPSIAENIKKHAAWRRTLVFVPLIVTSHKFVAACKAAGLRAEHVDGNMDDRADILRRFANCEFDVLSNAMLLTEGFDDPGIDAICVLRATRSRALYCQMVGRGTRLASGKKDLLLIDFLWHHEKHSLARPASLIADSRDHEEEMQEVLDAEAQEQVKMGREADSQPELDLHGVSSRVAAERERKIAMEIAKQRQRSEGTIDPIAFADGFDIGLSKFEPCNDFESSPVSPEQSRILKSNGLDADALRNRGQAAMLIDVVMNRARADMATPKQVKLIGKMGHRAPHEATFKEAAEFINQRIRGASTGRKYSFTN